MSNEINENICEKKVKSFMSVLQAVRFRKKAESDGSILNPKTTVC